MKKSTMRNNLTLTAVENARNKLQNIAADIFCYLGEFVKSTNCPVLRCDFHFKQECHYDKCQTIYESCEAQHYILDNYQRNTIQALAELYCASHNVFTNGDTTLEEVTESIKLTMLLQALLTDNVPQKKTHFSLN